MGIRESIRKRRSYYDINKDLSVDTDQVIECVKEVVSLVPDAYNMQSSKVVIALNEYQDQLWDTIYDVFAGKVKREKIDSFKAGAGTILFFIDEEIVKGVQDKFPRFAEEFAGWSAQASAMLQFSVWSALRDLDIGASLQHYNPVIDDKVKAMFNIPAHYKLMAQMPFGGIGSEPEPKDKVDIAERVKVFK